MGKIRLLWGMLAAALIVAACAPAGGDPLPTLAQLPETAPTDTAPALAEAPSDTPQPDLTVTPSETPPDTPTPTATLTETPTVTPSATITDTPTPTPTQVPSVVPEERPISGLLEAAISTTLLPTDFVVPPQQGVIVPIGTATPFLPGSQPGQGQTPPAASNCQYLPAGGFGTVYTGNPDIALQIGCPQGFPPDVLRVDAAWQPFQQGLMVWFDGDIYALYGQTRAYQRFDDTFNEAVDPATSSETPPQGLFAPVRGFNKVWSNNAQVRSGLGWGTAEERGVQATIQRFDRGMMIWLADRMDVLVFIGTDGITGSWRSVQGQF